MNAHTVPMACIEVLSPILHVSEQKEEAEGL